MEEVSKLIIRFEDFIKRTLIPSSSFWLMLIFLDINYNENKILEVIMQEHHFLMIILSLVVFLGVAVFLGILQQFIYDNNLKGNFIGTIFCTENKRLKEERVKVATKLKLTEYTDNILYQKIGKGMYTKRYVDEAKTIGIFFISLLIFLLSIIYFEWIGRWKVQEISIIFIILVTIVLMLIVYYIGKELVMSKYRSRAFRIYENYLNDI